MVIMLFQSIYFFNNFKIILKSVVYITAATVVMKEHILTAL